MIDLSSDNSKQFSEWRIKKCIHLKRSYMSSALTEQNTLKTFNFSRFVRTLAYPLSTILAQNELAHAMLSCFLTYFWYSLIQIIFFHDFNFKQLNASSLIWLFGYFVFSEQNKTFPLQSCLITLMPSYSHVFMPLPSTVNGIYLKLFSVCRNHHFCVHCLLWMPYKDWKTNERVPSEYPSRFLTNGDIHNHRGLDLEYSLGHEFCTVS